MLRPGVCCAAHVESILSVQLGIERAFRIREPLRPHLVCSRGFHPYYGIDVVVRAFGEIKQLYPEARLDLLGGGPQEKMARDLVRLLRLDGVNFTGVVSRQEIGKLRSG